ncbi:hypothetical protein [Pseudolactococcus insecticola]|uniref:Uncharacterized protein n=1 Tax=Pseudolactococcus insecticola TaxID=2709158 RepID=A0A6A0B8G0_9LACT|nr:hypothetical protein [Lactococcus insecticola]GFH40738.1 hypothetical protein Hs20B_11360 [Lactococcus insecticola]
MDIKKATHYRRKNINILMKDGKEYTGFFEDYADSEDVEVDTIQLENQELWGDWLKEIPVPEIQSIEEIK